QFVRGQAEKLSVELFFDTTEDGTGVDATSVTSLTDQIYQLAKVESSSHAPPIVTFCWNRHFPGDSLSLGGGQLRNSFVGVVESVRQQFTLFSSEGVPLRATVNLVLREYRTLDQQLDELKLSSPDKSHAHTLAERDTLSGLAHSYYRQQHEWRRIARRNDVEDPRRLRTGDFLTVPIIEDDA
ncbi:MAG: peptidoglycan-binding protein, partial [Pseudomonadota bacterium]